MPESTTTSISARVKVADRKLEILINYEKAGVGGVMEGERVLLFNADPVGILRYLAQQGIEPDQRLRSLLE